MSLLVSGALICSPERADTPLVQDACCVCCSGRNSGCPSLSSPLRLLVQMAVWLPGRLPPNEEASVEGWELDWEPVPPRDQAAPSRCPSWSLSSEPSDWEPRVRVKPYTPSTSRSPSGPRTMRLRELLLSRARLLRLLLPPPDSLRRCCFLWRFTTTHAATARAPVPTTAMPATSTVVVLKALPPPDRDVEAVVVLRTSHRTNSWASLQQDRLEQEQMHGAGVPLVVGLGDADGRLDDGLGEAKVVGVSGTGAMVADGDVGARVEEAPTSTDVAGGVLEGVGDAGTVAAVEEAVLVTSVDAAGGLVEEDGRDADVEDGDASGNRVVDGDVVADSDAGTADREALDVGDGVCEADTPFVLEGEDDCVSGCGEPDADVDVSGEACGVVDPLFVLVGVSDACSVLDGDGAAGAGLVDGDDVTLELSVRLTDDVGLAFALFEEEGLLVSVADSDEDVDREGGAELLLDMDCEAVGLGVGSNTTLTNRSKAPSPLMVLSWCNSTATRLAPFTADDRDTLNTEALA